MKALWYMLDRPACRNNGISATYVDNFIFIFFNQMLKTLGQNSEVKISTRFWNVIASLGYHKIRGFQFNADGSIDQLSLESLSSFGSKAAYKETFFFLQVLVSRLENLFFMSNKEVFHGLCKYFMYSHDTWTKTRNLITWRHVNAKFEVLRLG